MSGTPKVASAADLSAALADSSTDHIEVDGHLTSLRTFNLRTGVSLGGTGTLEFAPGEDGVELSGDNEITGLQINVEPRQRAVFAAGRGRIRLAGLTVTGQVDLSVTGGRVE